MSLSLSPFFSTAPLSRVLTAILASGLLAAASAAPTKAKKTPETTPQAVPVAAPAAAPAAQAAPEDDPYGIGSPAATPDTTPPATPRTGSVAADRLKTPAAPAPVATPDTTPAPRAPRTRITRETTVNPMNENRGSYRNPKKALFMSLIVPGLGQAYIGQTKFNYIRAALYFTADVTMGYLWYDYSVVKYDKKVKQYRRFADEHWRQDRYEGKITEMIGTVSDQYYFERFNPSRASYCQSVLSNEGAGAELYKGCWQPYKDEFSANYTNFKTTYAGDYDAQGNVNVAATGDRRASFPDDVAFYELIGRDQEFLFGCDDAQPDPSVPTGYNLTDTVWVGASVNREAYNGMRQTAKDYSRMQTWFLGGIVLNHIASAVDAALTARRHNRILYEDAGARLFDKVNLDGGMAMDLGRPRTYMTAYLSF